ncbi:MAG: hypothetical protein ACP5I4_01450 [Oceanipulchritudo sp.]
MNRYHGCTFEDIPDETYNGEHGHARIAPFSRGDPSRRQQLALQGG